MLLVKGAKFILQELHDKLSQIPAVCSMLQSIRDSFKEKRRGICKFRHWNGS